MRDRWRRLRNILGSLIKVSTLPLILFVLDRSFPNQDVDPVYVILAFLLIIGGLLGISISDLLILRFGDGNLHLSNNITRLVDVGFYARNRHPFFWFISIYHLGVLSLHSGFSILNIFIWLGITAVCTLGLLYQEKQLLRSLGSQYSEYKASTPFFTWKRRIPENRSVKLLPQLVWLFGMIVLRNLYRIQIEGREHIPHHRPFLLVANHESYLDPFLFGIFLPFELKFVTTADVFSTPWMRFLLRGIGTFPMRRHRQDLKSIRTMIRMINKGQVVGIFPEGGRSIDGSPLPILKETLKLIQRCKVPILPVHLEGAYEIWPRWAPNRRRGKVSASFKPIIPIQDQENLDDLEKLIQNEIFSPSKTFSKVKTHAIAKGLDNFLWACCKCHAHNAIQVISGDQIKCRQCESRWSVASDYTLSDLDSSQSHTLISWIEGINATTHNPSPEIHPSPALAPGEHMFLNASINKYLNENKPELHGDLLLILTDQRFILARQTEILDSWDLGSVTIFTMDYFNAISIGVGGIRHTFFLPAHEISLKWQTYFETLRAKII